MHGVRKSMMPKSILNPKEKGLLKAGEPHPSARFALEYILSIPYEELIMHQSAFASAALSGNELAEILSETLNRLLDGGPVSDRYLLGLAWFLSGPPNRGPEMILVYDVPGKTFTIEKEALRMESKESLIQLILDMSERIKIKNFNNLCVDIHCNCTEHSND